MPDLLTSFGGDLRGAKTDMSDLKDFTRAMLGDWLARMSGPLSVPAAALALWVSNDTAKILLGVTAFVCFWVTAYRVWKIEHDKMVKYDQKKRLLLDAIAALRETIGRYRIAMEKEVSEGRFIESSWKATIEPLRIEIMHKIQELSSMAEGSAYRHCGNIQRAINAKTGSYTWPVLIDVCIRDLDYLETFIHDYSRGRERRS